MLATHTPCSSLGFQPKSVIFCPFYQNLSSFRRPQKPKILNTWLTHGIIPTVPRGSELEDSFDWSDISWNCAWVPVAKTILSIPKVGQSFTHREIRWCQILLWDNPFFRPQSDTCGWLHTSSPPLNASVPNRHMRKPNHIHLWHVVSPVGSGMSVQLAQLEFFQQIACKETMRHSLRPSAGSYVTKDLPLLCN